jgi:hypothetical protein
MLKLNVNKCETVIGRHMNVDYSYCIELEESNLEVGNSWLYNRTLRVTFDSYLKFYKHIYKLNYHKLIRY